MMHLKLKSFFEKYGISQQEIAEALGVSPPYVNAILNGKKPLGKKNAERLANLYGLSRAFLLTGEGDIVAGAEEVPTEPVVNIPNMSSVFNSALAAKDIAIESLKRELHTKDDLIQSLRDQLLAKDQLIAEQKARLIDYRRTLDEKNRISTYPFPIGTAEGGQSQNVK